MVTDSGSAETAVGRPYWYSGSLDATLCLKRELVGAVAHLIECVRIQAQTPSPHLQEGSSAISEAARQVSLCLFPDLPFPSQFLSILSNQINE